MTVSLSRSLRQPPLPQIPQASPRIGVLSLEFFTHSLSVRRLTQPPGTSQGGQALEPGCNSPGLSGSVLPQVLFLQVTGDICAS